MKTVVFRAPLLSMSGYGTHARQIYRWLRSKENIQLCVSIVPWGITSWMIDPGLEDGLIADIMAHSAPPTSTPDVSLQLQLPNEWDPHLAYKNIGLSAVVETDKCNPEWLSKMDEMDAVIVPSTHVMRCVNNSGGIRTPIAVVPESYYDCIRDPDLPAFDLDIDTDFNLLVLGQVTGNSPYNDRKNLFFSLKYLCETFKDDPNVGIIVKTNSGRNTTIDRQITSKMLGRIIKEIRPGPYPKIHFVHGAMTPAEVAGIYKNPKVKALVALTRGEGFGLPILEAAASGLPVIATNWSAHLDFLNLGKWIKVAYSLEALHESRVDSNIFMDGARWAEPIEEDVITRLQKFRQKPEIPQEWAKELQKKILKQYSQEAIEKIYDEKLGKFLS